MQDLHQRLLLSGLDKLPGNHPLRLFNRICDGFGQHLFLSDQLPVADWDGGHILCVDRPPTLPLQAAGDRDLCGNDAADHQTVPERGYHGHSARSSFWVRLLYGLL